MKHLKKGSISAIGNRDNLNRLATEGLVLLNESQSLNITQGQRRKKKIISMIMQT